MKYLLDGQKVGFAEVSEFDYFDENSQFPIASFAVIERQLTSQKIYQLSFEYELDLTYAENVPISIDFPGLPGNISFPGFPASTNTSVNNLSRFNGSTKKGGGFPTVTLPPQDSSKLPLLNFFSRMSDVDFTFKSPPDAWLIERWFPSNLELDQYPVTLNFATTSDSKIGIRANGKITEVRIDKEYKVEFPAYFTPSCHFIHNYDSDTSNFQSITWDEVLVDGKRISVTIYTDIDRESVKKAISITKNSLEYGVQNIGPYPYDELLIFLRPDGTSGEEYAGALCSDLGTLQHEIFHNWFGRSVFPSNGNAGWIDEAIVSWLDNSKRPVSPLDSQKARLAGTNEYQRFTNQEAYTFGSKFFSEVYKLD